VISSKYGVCIADN